MSSTTSKVNTYVIHPIMVGAVGYGLSMVVLGSDNSSTVNIMNMDISPAVSCAVADVAGGVIAMELAKTSQMSELSASESMFITPVLTGMATVGVTRMMIGPTADYSAMMKIFGLGAGSEVAGSYLYNAVLPMIQKAEQSIIAETYIKNRKKKTEKVTYPLYAIRNIRFMRLCEQAT